MGQKIPAAQERPVEDQAVPPQLMGITQSRSPQAGMEEPMVLQFMWPKGGAAQGDALQEQPWDRAGDHREESEMWQEGCRKCHLWGTCVEQFLKGGPMVRSL